MATINKSRLPYRYYSCLDDNSTVTHTVNIADDARVSYNSVVIEDVKKTNDSDIFYI